MAWGWIFGYKWTRYVTVDIAKSLNSEGVDKTRQHEKKYGTHYYKDGDNNIVYLRESPFKSSSLQGYSRLVHTLQPDTHTHRYLLKEVQYNSVKQNIPERIESTHSVTAVYLGHDEERKIPLMIGLQKYSGYYRYSSHYIHYYVRDSGVEYEQWQYDRSVTSEGKALTETLRKIVEKCNYPSILNVGKTGGSYFIDGEKCEKSFKLYRIPKFTVKKSENDPVQGYVKYNHTLTNGSEFRIFYTTHDKKYQKFTDKDFYKRGSFKEACFYYWAGDTGHSNPLLLELKHKDDKSYYRLENDTWINITIFKSIFYGRALIDALDVENCKKNNAVVLDISQTYGHNFLQFGHACHKNITVTKHTGNPSDYDGYHHSLKEGYKIGRFTYGWCSATLNPLDLPLKDTSVFVFHCCNCKDKKLSLIYFKGTKACYKNSKGKPYEWNIYTVGINDENDKGGIEKILKQDDAANTTTTIDSSTEEESVEEEKVETEDVPTVYDESNSNEHNPNLWHLLWLVPIIILIILLILYCYYYLRDPWVRQI